MPRDVAVVFVHGILAENLNYAEAMRNGLWTRISPQLRRHIRFEPLFWASSIRNMQQAFLDHVRESVEVGQTDLRRFFVHGLGDAAAYQKVGKRRNSSYYQIQDTITRTLRSLDTPGFEARPLILIGHSLGCHIISSYAWDINWLKQLSDDELAAITDEEFKEFVLELRAASPFRRLDTFAGFVTMGSNMPLFTFTFGPDQVYPITIVPPGYRKRSPHLTPAFPGVKLSSGVAQKSRWLNFHSKSDYLGYPLKAINALHRDEERLRDCEVQTESLLWSLLSQTRLKPFYLMRFLSAHTRYWVNPKVLDETARLIEDIVNAPEHATVDQQSAGAVAADIAADTPPKTHAQVGDS